MPSLTPLALQLYSVRDAAAGDYRGVLRRVAAAGYLGVEIASLHGNDPGSVRGWLAEEGLTAIGAHRPLPIGEAREEVLDELSELGVDVLVVPWAAPQRFADLASLASLADDLLQAQHNAAARGISLGYHNHHFELATRLEGRTALAHLFELVGGPVFAEIDVYWARVGGVDPARLIVELGPLVRLLHIKDGPARDTVAPMTAVGSGVIDFPSIVAASTNVAWHIVELDACATDMFEAIEASQRWLVAAGLSRGRG